jgi:hypothetical protein
VLIKAISGQKLTMPGRRYTPTGMRGWSGRRLPRDDDHRATCSGSTTS